jgi:anti-sigma regulatory factor (Ser/Thr protein kinase)
MTVITSVKDRPMTSTPHIGDHLGSVIFPVAAESAHLAREWLGIIFDAWSLPALENAQLCVSELVANVFTHARGTGTALTIVTRRIPDRVQVDVYDGSDDPPEIDRTTRMSESGNGLFLIDAIVGRANWGFHPTDSGKCVWFTIPDGPRCPR